MIFAINVVVNTKTGDVYDQVAINKFPVLIRCENKEKLWELLDEDGVRRFIKNHMSRYLYNSAMYMIRYITDSGKFTESFKFERMVKDVTKVIYDDVESKNEI
ncbi:MAG: hypothetical protein IKU29_07045 [Parabacteroides sp.]|nr:hypothetical protein [Parabacteroides sp.]